MTRQRFHLSNPKRALFAALLSFLPVSAFAQAQVQVSISISLVAPGVLTGGCSAVTATQFQCTVGATPVTNNISNDPRIEFELDGAGRCIAGPFPTGTVAANYCNDKVFLCSQIHVVNNTGSPVAIDEVSMELFKFQDGSNALDPASTPPLRTFFIDTPGNAPTGTSDLPGGTSAYCVLWDGSYNIQGEFGKTNGQFGFRTTVKTNQVGPSGNITITATRAYPSGTTRDSGSNVVLQKPISVDVTNVHVVRSSPTVVGQITGVSAQPYNLTYRLAKDAQMYLTVNSSTPPYTIERNVLPGLPRVGEGVPNGTLLNGDAWDGRDNQGQIMPPGSYLGVFQAISVDQFTNFPAVPGDLSVATTRQIAIDPLQITDIRVQPLAGGSTSLAVLSYLLTESATMFIDIYSPDTVFCQGLSAVNDPAFDGPTTLITAKNFDPRHFGCGSGFAGSTPLRTISEIKVGRQPVISFWDGRDSLGNLVGDGDYQFVMYAALPSGRGQLYRSQASDKRIWTSQARTGFLPVVRGMVGITQISPTTSVIGSSPAIAGLNPFSFRYQLSRDAVVTFKIFDINGQVVKTVVTGETRPGLFNNTEFWVDGTNDAGQMVSSGTYLAQLTAVDPDFPSKVSTTTVLFPVDLFRITDVAVTPLLSGASDQVVLNYQLSQPSFVAWNIYPAGSFVQNSATSWPPCPTQSPPGGCTSTSVLTPSLLPAVPIVTFRGLRAARLRISEFWDGRDGNGLFVPDGNYVYTLTAQSTSTPKFFATDRVYGNITVARGSIVFTQFNVLPDVPQLFNSSNTITLHPFTIQYAITRQSSVTLQILNTSLTPTVIRTILSGAVKQGGILQTEVWDGRDDKGNFPVSGFYLVRAVAEDVASVLSSGSTAQLTISHDPLRIYDLAVTPLRNDTDGGILGYQVSEPMKVAVKIYAPGTIFDASGNPSPPENVSLVKRIVGLRPARTEIRDVWNGTDLRLSLVKDGSYKFKIVGSTDLAAIDDLTGNVLNPAALSLDRLIDDMPVARNASVNPENDFENNTFVYPNPISGPTATFQIYSPYRAKVSLRMHNMVGDLVFQRDFGEVAPAFQAGPLSYVWNKVNSGGRTVARGLYFVVIRIEETEGGTNVLQTVKKVLIP